MILLLIEHNEGVITPGSLATITAAKSLPGEINLVVAGKEITQAAHQLSTIDGIQQVFYFDNPACEHLLPETLVALILPLAKKATYVLAPSSSFGKSVLPRMAATLDVGQISDVIKIIDAETFERPIYAGNAIARVRCLDPIKVMTVRAAAFQPAVFSNNAAQLSQLDFINENNQSRFVSEEKHKLDRPSLSAAKIIVSGGRGLGDKASFERLMLLADKLGAAVGASRAAVDAGLAPNDWQVGQTGQIVAPGLYIAMGISGAIQHIAGMKDSKVIIAINKDPEAPIFQVADYGLVADLFEVMGVLEREL